ncbi:carbohydrate-binding protein [Pontibacter sp. G13]|uniref:carbohydrate-binding protein n=1 Tax=Pontibacter sp. G13 TaxID=3074898 RepID=UPI00288AEA54|nr:carbohydrate-binding protein [Pontibacter sp. G13]WNJ19121.1 carbohydrate-binding protein [Pontibacter sp. G13]
MKTLLKFLPFLWLGIGWVHAQNSVTTYNWPSSADQSNKYSVKVYADCNSYDLFTHYSTPNLDQSGPDGDGVTGVLENRSMSFVQFAFTGEVEMEVTKLYGTAAQRVEISPKTFGIEPTYFDGTTVRFRINRNMVPCYISVNFVAADNKDSDNSGGFDILNGLMIFGDAPETNAPSQSGSGTVVWSNSATASQIQQADLIYFPPGDHDLSDKFTDPVGGDGRLFLTKPNQEVYVAGGAIVRGSIDGNAYDGVKLYGRGIVTGQDRPWHYYQDGGKKVAYLDFRGCDNFVAEGIVIENPTHHTIPSATNTTIRNLKIIGWASNHDGVRPGSGSLVEEVFIKTSDDYDYARDPHTFRNSVVWPMRNGATGQLGWNNLGTGFAAYKNIYVIHAEWNSFNRNRGFIGSVLEQGTNMQKDTIMNLYGENYMSLLANITMENEPSDPFDPNNPGLIKEFYFKNIILENKFQAANGNTIKNPLRGFTKNGATAEVRDIEFVNLVLGNTIVTNSNKGQFFDIDPATTSNITFTTEGNIYDITTSANAGGAISPSGTVPTPAGMDRYITVIPDSGNKIADVKVDGVSVGRQQNIFFPDISANHTVEVVFASGADYFGSAYDCGSGGGGTPGNISDLSATAVNCSTVSLTWSDGSGETAYRIRRKISGASTFTTLGDVNANVTTYTDNSAQESTSYLYQVRPVVNNVAVAVSNEPSIQIPACGGGGGTPGDISDLAAVATGCGSVTLSWSDESGEDGYRIRRKVTGTSTYLNLTDVSANTTSYQDNSVAANTSYTYMVRARLNNTNVGISNTPNVNVPTCASGAPIPGLIEAEDYDAMNGIQTENTADVGGGLNVGFIQNGDYLDFDVNVASSGTYTVDIRVATNTSGGTIQIKQGSTILGTATVSNTGGWQSWATISTSVSLTAGSQTLRAQFVGGSGFLYNVNWLDFSTGGARKAQAESISEIVVFPNPADDLLSIQGLDRGTHIRILKLLGASVWEGHFSGKLDISTLSQGVYLLHAEGHEPVRFIKQ